MDTFTIKYEGGYMQVNIKNYFVKAGLPDIKKLFKLAKEHCTEEYRIDLLNELTNAKEFWNEKYRAGKNRYSYSISDRLTPSTEKQHVKLQSKLDRVIEILKAEKWKDEISVY